jgi:hypothetical protein
MLNKLESSRSPLIAVMQGGDYGLHSNLFTPSGMLACLVPDNLPRHPNMIFGTPQIAYGKPKDEAVIQPRMRYENLSAGIHAVHQGLIRSVVTL